MADAVTSQTLMDGGRNVVMKFTNVSDGTGESAVTKVDASALEAHPDGRACAGVVIDKIVYTTRGMSVQILWDATTDVPAIDLPADMSDTLDFCAEGGLRNNSGTGKTGDIKFTTTGHTAGDTYSIVLHMRKKY